MMIFCSIYGIIDGLFVTNFAGSKPFAAICIIFPVLNILGTIGYMFGVGGSAIVAKTLGEQNREKANSLFSLFIYISSGLSLLMTIVGLIFIRPLAIALKAEGEILEYCVQYASILLLALPAWILQYEFQTFMVTAEKPHLGLAITILAGITNIVLDAMFIGVFNWGIVGAALATSLSQVVGGVIPIFYFAFKNKSLLRLGKTHFDFKMILRALFNGSSEFVSSISTSLISILFNLQLIKYAGENGVAAYGVLMYVSMIFYSMFTGFSNGIGPAIGFHYGAKDESELKSLRKKCLRIIIVASLLMFIVSETCAYPLSWIFTRQDQALMAMTIRAFELYSICFLLSGVVTFGSALFTSLNNGVISAIISFIRTIVFEAASVIVFPMLLGLDGIWISAPIADFLAVIMTLCFIKVYQKKYHY